MTEQEGPKPIDSPASTTARIDQMCDEFEKACRAGAAADRGGPAPGRAERDRLLAELLEIELDCRQRAGTFLQVEDYRDRFPGCPEMVESVFRRVVKSRRLADYELLEELGRGGMGVVYKARQVYLNQIVAVKILPHHYLDDAQAVGRFRREMQSIGALSHPNIVGAYNAGEAGGVHFLVMEFVDGVNLQRYVDIGNGKGESPHLPERPSGCSAQMGTVPFSVACEILRQAALGLQHAHEHQLVHRDIKPANLMLSRDGQVKILDMGLAKFNAETRGGDRPQDRLTQPGITLGTVDYMAPEQWENPAGADIRADIYSLGCTLFFLLTGKPPYSGPAFDTGRKKLMAHAVAAIPSLMENCPDVPEELEAVYEKMLAKNPDDRFATPLEAAEALAEFADAEELAEVVAALPPREVCLRRRTPDRSSPTPPRTYGRARLGHGLRPALSPHRAARIPVGGASRWASRQKFQRNVTIGIAAGLTAAFCVLLTWAVIRSRHQPQSVNQSQASPVADPVIMTPAARRRWPPT